MPPIGHAASSSNPAWRSDEGRDSTTSRSASGGRTSSGPTRPAARTRRCRRTRAKSAGGEVQSDGEQQEERHRRNGQIQKAFTRRDQDGTPGRESLPLDAQLLHAGLERGGLDGENASRPIGAADAPSCLSEHVENMSAFDFLERQRRLQHLGASEPSGSATRSVGPSVRIIDRSMTLRNSRTLPGQE